MTTTTEAKPWDFSHVLDLVNSLSFLPELPPPSLSKDKGLCPERDRISNNIDFGAASEDHHNGSNNELQGLGDFSKLWEFLGSTGDSSHGPLAVQPPQTNDERLTARRNFAGYNSDSAIHSKPSNKGNAAREEKEPAALRYQSSAEEETADAASDGSMGSNSQVLTRTQRKKRNRRARREAEAAAFAKEQAVKAKLKSTSDSEAKHALHKTPTRPTNVHNVDDPAKKQYNLRARDANGTAICATDLDAANNAHARTPKVRKPRDIIYTTPGKDDGLANSFHSPEQALQRQRSNPNLTASKNSIISAGDIPQTRPFVTPIKGNTHQFFPSSVQPPPPLVPRTSLQPSSLPNGGSVPRKLAKSVEPLTARSGEDRDWALLLKLIVDFKEDRRHLISPMNLTTHNNDPNGIHVFVDASNIFIGFKDQLRFSRGIPATVQVPAADLSFDSLALLMERRRPVAKRVLVGSTPHLAAFDKAKAVGYECNILEKVYKARELTERQIYFKELDRARHTRKHAKAPPANNVVTVNGGVGSGSGSGSETNAPQYAPPRLIEQGVDEILHMKILESIVDTDAPSTIVLATGDAARAEYSEGFMVMLERALKRGWRVELVSWSKNISAMYTRREWTEAWGDQFCIVTLDDYVEELHDM